jgi:hypothetical protein
MKGKEILKKCECEYAEVREIDTDRREAAARL